MEGFGGRTGAKTRQAFLSDSHAQLTLLFVGFTEISIWTRCWEAVATINRGEFRRERPIFSSLSDADAEP